MQSDSRERAPLDAKLVKVLKRISTPTATTALIHFGFKNAYMEGIPQLAESAERERMVGLARTLRFLPLREDLVEAQYANVTGSPHRNALESIRPGEVLVVDTGGNLTAGIAGDMFARRIFRLGGAGLVVDGAIRDLTSIRTVGLAVYARGVHGAPIPRSLMSVGVDEVIRCGGIAVVPGDVILGDADGVVAIPRQIAEDFARYCLEHDNMEVFTRWKLHRGASLHDVYPPVGESLVEYERWKKENPVDWGGLEPPKEAKGPGLF
jgi:regulator of RNase E activity RraA